MRTLFLCGTIAFTLACGLKPAHASGETALNFQGTVYQVDTVFNFVDVIMPGGTRRFYGDNASRVRVSGRKAALIDIAMGEQVRGTYRLDAKGNRIIVRIDDVTRR